MLKSTSKSLSITSLNVAWTFSLVMTGIALIQSLNLINPILSSVTIGITVLFGSVIALIEALFEGDGFDLSKLNLGKILGLILGLVGIIHSIALMGSIEMITEILSPYQWLVIGVLFIYLWFEGSWNRS